LTRIKRRRFRFAILIERKVTRRACVYLYVGNITPQGSLVMAFKTILTVTGLEEGDGDVKLAARLCEEAGAHLSILALAFAPPPPVGDYAVMTSDVWIQERQADMMRLVDRNEALEGLVSRLGVSCDISTEYPEGGWADDVIGRRARYADLTFMGPDMLKSGRLMQKIVEGALFASGKPLLIVPENTRPTLAPQTIVVGWDARIEASRAVREALDMMKGASQVRLTLIDPEQGEVAHGDEPGADAAAYLSRHGIKVTVDRLPSGGDSVATVLTRHAVDCGADLLVMGGYGHSRLRERVFGGVTRKMLEQPKVPILMAH
jgi:nucleotide-binding universal stress UspA family protein